MRRAPASILLALLAGASSADTVETRDGRRLEGKIVEETATAIVVETPFGRAEIARADVVSIRRGPSPREEYASRRAQAGSAEDHFRLHLFCKAKGLATEARAELDETVRLDPAHEAANRALGRVPFEGKWVSPAERDRLAAEREEAAFRAKGLVPHEGRWVTPEEKEALEKGFVLHEGKWVPEEVAMRAKGLVRHEGGWIPAPEAAARTRAAEAARALALTLNCASSAHFVVAGPYDEAYQREVADGAERVVAFFDRVFGPGSADAALEGRRAELYLVESRADFQRAVPHFASGNRTVNAAWIEYTKGSNGFILYEPTPISVAGRFDRERETLLGHTLHHVGHILLNRRGANGTLLPPWYDEGFACLGEAAATGVNAIFCRAPAASAGGGGPGHFGSGTGVRETKVEPPDRVMEGPWREQLARAAAAGVLPPFDQIARRELSDLTPLEIAEAMRVIEWIESRGAESLSKLHAGIRRRMPPSPLRTLPANESRELHDAAFEESVGLRLDGVERALRDALAAEAPPPASQPAPPLKKKPGKGR